MWFTRAMYESPAWDAMPLAARRVMERVVLEHMAHGGTRNGELVVTYDDFARYGLSSRRATATGLRAAEALGFIDVTARGRLCYGGARVASRYGLTWLPRCDGTPASNRWEAIVDRHHARNVVKESSTAAPRIPATAQGVRATARARAA